MNSSPQQQSPAVSTRTDKDGPALLADRSFWGMLCTQFLGAFNDNLYKQLVLLLAAPTAVAIAVANQDAGALDPAAAGANASDSDVQGWATLIFSLPFVLFSGYAGFISDRFSKRPIINYCKVAEIAIMGLGLCAFVFYGTLGMAGTWTVLFLMGTQSAFFGPGKYGILPELFRERDLPRANAIILMTTFLAIIFGTVLAGGLKVALVGEGGDIANLWIALSLCMLIAVLGTLTSYMVRRVPPAKPDIKLTSDCLGVSNEIRSFLGGNRMLLGALIVSSVFWLVSGIAVPTVNRLGRWLGVNDLQTSVLTASIGFGIIGGAMFASFLCRKGYGDQCVTLGLSGICACLAALGMWSGEAHLLGYYGSVSALVILGVFAAVFAIPLQVYIQSRPPAALKGRMIATMNQANFVGILLAGPLYQLFEAIAAWCGWPICSVFWMMGLLVLPLVVLYRLDSDVDEAPEPAPLPV